MGDPAFGPPAYIHRLSIQDDPEAPISHHWLDSTHGTQGVITAGFVAGNIKIEVSGFRGHEPDQHRYDIARQSLFVASARRPVHFRRLLSDGASQGQGPDPSHSSHVGEFAIINPQNHAKAETESAYDH